MVIPEIRPFPEMGHNQRNHTQFQGDGINGDVSTTFGSSNFGNVTSAYDPRIIQLELKSRSRLLEVRPRWEAAD